MIERNAQAMSMTKRRTAHTIMAITLPFMRLSLFEEDGEDDDADVSV